MDPHRKIKDKQIKICKKFSEKNPSSLEEVSWIYACNNDKNYPHDTKESGKWCLFIPTIQIDDIWKIVKKATEDGLLGDSSKVSTKLGNELRQTSKETRVICIYTYNGDDIIDIHRIRDKLIDLGLQQYISHYKLNKYS